MSLLLHSLFEFWPVINTVLQVSQAKLVTEIGAEFATTTKALCEWASEDKARRIISIDTIPSPGLLELQKKYHQLQVYGESSLKQLQLLPVQDLYLIDGDHNYYTVHNELARIHQQSTAQDHPVVIILHDVAWPCARRDQYYAPEQIPVESRHLSSFERGITVDNPNMVKGGFRGEGAFAYAEKEGGPENGVLTAIEDFLASNNAYEFITINAIFGIGFLVAKKHPALAEIQKLLAPFSDNYLIGKLERNRLDLYLRVIALQDELNEIRSADRLSQ